MKWHIVGADGYVGSNLLRRLPAGTRCIRYVQKTDTAELAPEEKAFELTALTPEIFADIDEGDFVVFLAAISSPDFCEKQYDFARSINVTGTTQFIETCIGRGANVLFFSSDVVNGGTLPCSVDETYVGTPIGKYGEMKREIEQRFYGNPHFKVFRLSYVYSRQDKFSRYLDDCAGKGVCAEVFDALYRSVIYLEDIFEAIFRLSETFGEWENTIFNLSGPELLSRKDLAVLYVQNVAPSLRFVPIIPPEDFFRARPNIIATKSLYLEKLLKRPPTHIGQAMKNEYHKGE